MSAAKFRLKKNPFFTKNKGKIGKKFYKYKSCIIFITLFQKQSIFNVTSNALKYELKQNIILNLQGQAKYNLQLAWSVRKNRIYTQVSGN